MTFTYKIKSEIYRSKAFRGPRRAAQAYGLLLFGKHFGEEAIGLVTENKRVTKLYANAITDLVGITESITIKETKHTGNSVFAVSVDSREDRECSPFSATGKGPKASEWRTWRRKGIWPRF